MPVVINELEVTPPPPGKTDGAGRAQSNQDGPAAIKPDTLREIEKALHRNHQRIERLAAC